MKNQLLNFNTLPEASTGLWVLSLAEENEKELSRKASLTLQVSDSTSLYTTGGVTSFFPEIFKEDISNQFYKRQEGTVWEELKKGWQVEKKE